jgi:hypothetical protein
MGREQKEIFTVSNTHPTNQSRNRLLREHVANHAVGLTLIKTSSGCAGDDSACVLASVLQQRQALAYFWCRVDGRVVQE